MRSNRIRRGFSRFIFSIASTPLYAVATAYPDFSKNSSSAFTKSFSSSAMSIKGFGPASVLMFANLASPTTFLKSICSNNCNNSFAPQFCTNLGETSTNPARALHRDIFGHWYMGSQQVEQGKHSTRNLRSDYCPNLSADYGDSAFLIRRGWPCAVLQTRVLTGARPSLLSSHIRL